MYGLYYFENLLTMHMYEGFAQEESRKINEKRGWLFRRSWSQQGQKMRFSE